MIHFTGHHLFFPGREKSIACLAADTAGSGSGQNIITETPDFAPKGAKGEAPADEDLTGQRFGKLKVTARKSSRAYYCKCDCGTELIVSASDLKRGHNKSCGCERSRARTEDITGLRSGRVVALERTEQKRSGTYLWRCRCDCGKEFLVECYRITGGTIQSCGCERSERLQKDLTGQRFGKLVAVERLDVKTDRGRVWLCQCDCGKTTKVAAKALLSGNTKSCGCGKSDAVKRTIATHGTIADHNHFVDGTCVELLKRKKLNANNTSGYTGVQKRPNGKWAAILTFKGKVHYLGIYDRIEDAIAARKRGEEEYFDKFLEEYHKSPR